MEKKTCTLILLLLMACQVSASCFDENTTVEGIDFGKQGVDVLGCKLVEIKGNMDPFVITGIFVVILGFAGVLCLVGLIVLGKIMLEVLR